MYAYLVLGMYILYYLLLLCYFVLLLCYFVLLCVTSVLLCVTSVLLGCVLRGSFTHSTAQEFETRPPKRPTGVFIVPNLRSYHQGAAPLAGWRTRGLTTATVIVSECWKHFELETFQASFICHLTAVWCGHAVTNSWRVRGHSNGLVSDTTDCDWLKKVPRLNANEQCG